MNDNAKKWVSALRSGKFRQGRGTLKYGDQHCCLGVACVLYAEEHPEFSVETTPNGYTKYGEDQHTTTLPSEVTEWLGLRTHTGDYVTGDYLGSSLMADNDDGKPFGAIAAVIENEPEGLFKEEA